MLALSLDLGNDTERLLGSGVRIVLILVAALVLRRVSRRVIRGVVARVQAAPGASAGSAGSSLDSGRLEARTNALSTVFNSTAGAFISVMAILLILGELRVNLAPLLASAGIAAAALAFGAQSLVRDTLSGIFILIEDQFGVGDTIDVGPATGTVERVTLRSTRIRDLAGTVWHVPNGAILRVGNKSQNWARAVIEVVVSFEADVRAAREIMRTVAEELAADPEWAAVSSAAAIDEQGISALTPLGVTLRLVVDVEPAAQWRIERELRLRIKEAFDASGVPFEVHHQ